MGTTEGPTGGATVRASAFPFVELRGGPRERGRQFGEACREQVRAYPQALSKVLKGEAQLRAVGVTGGAGGGGPSVGELEARALTFLPSFEAFAPHLVEEIRGVAEGAGVSFATALLVNVRAEVAGVRAAAPQRPDGCTSFAAGRGATAGGAVFLGQNQDQDPEMEAFGVVVRVRPDEGPPAVMATFGGLVGYPGVNGAGVAFFQNALANGVWRHGLPHYPLKRVLLEQATVEDCLGVFDRAPLASCGNYVLGDGRGRLLDVEATPEGYDVLEPEGDVVVHSNHFRGERFSPGERLLGSLPDSAPRLERMRALLGAQHGRITLETVQQALRDHAGGSGAICRHDPERPMKTIASIVAEPDARRLHVARGNPCENDYVTYSVA
jgi:isopenicillin-N N-acyltransferase-like protein